MKTMIIYEPAMCCSTGLCGVGIDKELLRITTVLSNLEKNNVKVSRHNLSDAPEKFAENTELNKLLGDKGINILPVTTVDGVIVKTGAYPANKEITQLLEIPDSFTEESKNDQADTTGGCCSDSNVCDIRCAPKNGESESSCTDGGGCC